jgi:hypothetical protein
MNITGHQIYSKKCDGSSEGYSETGVHKYSYSASITWLNLWLIMRTTAMGPPPLDPKYKGLFLIK